jgi:hypothetical protein
MFFGSRCDSSQAFANELLDNFGGFISGFIAIVGDQHTPMP